jgi:hypothetical protein
MIRVNENEQFPIVVQLVNEESGELASGETVYYDIRDMADNPLSPAVSGTLIESTVEPGIYKSTASIPDSGRYVIYATCSGFLANTEEIIVNPENIYELVKQNRHYNISVEDVIRTNATPTASQTIRNVPMNRTDYVITTIKRDSDPDWSSTTTSGIVYAWYRNITEDVPYKMGDDGV